MKIFVEIDIIFWDDFIMHKRKDKGSLEEKEHFKIRNLRA